MEVYLRNSFALLLPLLLSFFALVELFSVGLWREKQNTKQPVRQSAKSAVEEENQEAKTGRAREGGSVWV